MRVEQQFCDSIKGNHSIPKPLSERAAFFLGCFLFFDGTGTAGAKGEDPRGGLG